MVSQLDNIKVLIPELPNKDADLGMEFLNKRDFESLKSLVSSAIVRIRRSKYKHLDVNKYDNINIEELYKLKSLIETYMAQIYF